MRSILLCTLLIALAACNKDETPTDDADTDTDSDTSDTGPDTDPADFEVEERTVIYQLVVRTFSNTNESRIPDGTLEQNGVGKFDDINQAAIDGLKELGITHVWLTGIPRQATMTDYSSIGLPADDADIVKGRAGSFYAVRDYFDVCPDYANDPAQRMAEFEALVQRLHDNDLKVIIDLVPNHVARSYNSVVRPDANFGSTDNTSAFFDNQNHFFYLVDPPGQALELSRPAGWSPSGEAFDGRFGPEDGSPGRPPKATGNNVTSPRPSANDWYETIKLNYGLNFATGDRVFDPQPKTWGTVDEILAFWQSKGVDGFRADFAHFVPNEAWSYLLAEAKTRDPEVFFIAEAYADLDGLLNAGFDSVYHDEAYDTLKAMYTGQAGQSNLDAVLGGLPEDKRGRYAHYLENHDERRIPSPIGGSPDDSGFGSANAGRQLAPLLYLYNQGPLLFYAGQEVGEAGAGVEGFGGDDGRTSIFDYWSMPAMTGWVNGGAYDGGGLTEEQRALRQYYAEVLALSHDPSVRGSGYWGLDYWNQPGQFADASDAHYSFARYEPGTDRLVVVVGNFDPNGGSTGRIRIPPELVDAAGLTQTQSYGVTRVLTEAGAGSDAMATLTGQQLIDEGFDALVGNQASHVFVIE